MLGLSGFLLLIGLPIHALAHDDPASLRTQEGPVDCPALLSIRTLKVIPATKGTALVTPAGSRFRHFAMRPHSFGENGKYSTTVYYSTKSVAPGKASVVVGLFHGMNAEISHGGSMFNMMQALTKAEKNIEPGSALDQMRKKTPRVQDIYAEAPDLPGCGNNSDITPLDTYEGIIDYYTQYVKDLRARAPNRPFVAVGFCYSSGFLIEVSRRNPGLIDGLILTGLIVPERELGLEFAIGVESEMYRSGSLAKNPAVQTRADPAYGNLPWGNQDQPTGTTPTLLLIGQKDPFQSESAKSVFQAWAKKNPSNLKYLEVKGGGHGVLGPIEGHPNGFVTVLTEVNRMLKRVQK